MAKKQKYYVVWKGHKAGIFKSWDECLKMTKGFTGAKYKAYPSMELATKAFKEGAEKHWGKAKKNNDTPNIEDLPAIVERNSLAVDAACAGNPGIMEYRGVHLRTGKVIFHMGPLEDGTNNIGEFLALVHALAFLKANKSNLPIYSDSRTAISWVNQRVCKSLLKKNAKNAKIFELIHRAENWLQSNRFSNPIHKWETKTWGEIPADFGRK